MTLEVTIDASALNALVARSSQVRAVVAEESHRALDMASAIVETRARENILDSGAYDTGALYRAMGRRVGTWEASIFNSMAYAEAVERGRRRGAKMPPPGVLRGWMFRRGIPIDREFVIRRAIARRGIPARPFLIPAREEAQPEIDAVFANALRRTASRVFAP